MVSFFFVAVDSVAAPFRRLGLKAKQEHEEGRMLYENHQQSLDTGGTAGQTIALVVFLMVVVVVGILLNHYAPGLRPIGMG